MYNIYSKLITFKLDSAALDLTRIFFKSFMGNLRDCWHLLDIIPWYWCGFDSGNSGKNK